jgi:hypothetical protein
MDGFEFRDRLAPIRSLVGDRHSGANRDSPPGANRDSPPGRGAPPKAPSFWATKADTSHPHPLARNKSSSWTRRDMMNHTSPGRRPHPIHGNVTFPASTRRRSKTRRDPFAASSMTAQSRCSSTSLPPWMAHNRPAPPGCARGRSRRHPNRLAAFQPNSAARPAQFVPPRRGCTVKDYQCYSWPASALRRGLYAAFRCSAQVTQRPVAV